jgi:hypothetical protein
VAPRRFFRLLASLSGASRLDEGVRTLDERYAGLADEDVRAALEDS